MTNRILAIDPGTHCGWALQDGDTLTSGVWNLRPNRHESAGMRFMRLQGYLNKIGVVDAVYYELVRCHLGTDAAHIYGGILGVLTAWCESWEPEPIPYKGIPVGTIKKHATGKGNAKKPAMTEAAQAKWPEQGVRGHDQADALWVLDTAIHNGGSK